MNSVPVKDSNVTILLKSCNTIHRSLVGMVNKCGRLMWTWKELNVRLEKVLNKYLNDQN